MPYSREPTSAGFTLIELLVVLAIVALMLGLITPRLGASLQRAALAGAGAEICAALRAAGSDAVAEDRVTVFRGDGAEGGGYWIDQRHYALTAAEARGAIAVVGRVSFFPWGGSSGGRVGIEGPDGRREIVVDAVTGRGLLHP